MAALALIPYTLLAQGIYSGLIGTISTVTIGACHVVKSIYTHKNPDVIKLITELDIERRLKLIQAVLNTIDHESKTKIARMKLDDLEKTQIFELVGAETDLDNDPIELCLLYLHEIIQYIHNDLTAINKKVEYHNTKWFSSWRILSVKTFLENLRLHSKLLESRFDDLTKISMFLKNK
jgi:hypothetical protein